MKNYKIRPLISVWILFAIVAGCFSPIQNVNAKTVVKASVSEKKVKVGKQISIHTKTSAVTYASSNSTIASVDSEGIVTGKKVGKVIVSVKKKGFTPKKIEITVVKNKRKPKTLPVTFSEIKTKVRHNTLYVKNCSKKGKVKKIIFYYQKEILKNTVSEAAIEADTSAETETAVSSGAISSGKQPQKTVVTFVAKNISSGKTVAAKCLNTKKLEGISISSMELVKIKMYTGAALYVYDNEEETYRFKWATKDTKAPKITGLVKKKSYTGLKDIYRVYYSDKKNTYNFKRFVSAVDNRDGKVKIKVDTSKINWKKEGVYRIRFKAKDSAGNTATSWAKVRVLLPGTSERAADQILNKITRTSWSNTKKAKAIYSYIRSHCSYVHNAAHLHWRKSGLNGFRYQSGDCYTYYSMARLLLTRAGIYNVMIKRYPTPGGRRHYWNLAYVQNGWYHFDTTPRSRKGYFCLRTDGQLWAYSSGYTFKFKKSLYPKRATKKITK